MLDEGEVLNEIGIESFIGDELSFKRLLTLTSISAPKAGSEFMRTLQNFDQQGLPASNIHHDDDPPMYR